MWNFDYSIKIAAKLSRSTYTLPPSILTLSNASFYELIDYSNKPLIVFIILLLSYNMEAPYF